VGSVLDPDTVDAARGVTVTSRSAVARGAVARRIERFREQLDELDLGGEERAQLQVGSQGRGTRGGGGADFSDATDRTRPADAGGSFEDVRQDSLTQTQDALREQAERPDAGDFERSRDPIAGSNRGPIQDPDSGDVELQRTTGSADVGEVVVEPPTSGGGTTAAGIGTIAEVNDPTGIAPGETTDSDTVTVDELVGGDTDATGGGQSRLKTIPPASRRALKTNSMVAGSVAARCRITQQALTPTPARKRTRQPTQTPRQTPD
jgi:hypothetical protein